MIYHCYRKTDEGVDGCGIVWTHSLTHKRVLPFRTRKRLCPDCQSEKGDRQPRSRRRRKR